MAASLPPANIEVAPVNWTDFGQLSFSLRVEKSSQPDRDRPLWLVKPLWRVVSDPDRGLIYEFATHSGAAAKAKEFAEDRVAEGIIIVIINYY
ncbi:MAG: hypothetical protein EXR36_14090 [Betaproteobacteria bacterium]|nr:hypothetical protein [Betaproteobacteria bacterium]